MAWICLHLLSDDDNDEERLKFKPDADSFQHRKEIKIIFNRLNEHQK